MQNLTAALTDEQALGGLAGIRGCLPSLARHILITTGFCALIAVLLWLAKPGQRFDVQLAYSLATGLSSWLVIDLSRFFVDVASPFRFPRGWRGVSVIFVGVCVGFFVGTLVGDAYSGRSTFELLPNQPLFLLYLFLFTACIGAGISYFFYASARSSYLTSALETSRQLATEAQLKLLQSQLEPHMLFNTLANLRVLIGMDPARAQAMLDRLIAFLRANGSESFPIPAPLPPSATAPAEGAVVPAEGAATPPAEGAAPAAPGATPTPAPGAPATPAPATPAPH
jgi:hypothetical protein